MKKVMFLLLALLIFIYRPCFAIDTSTDEVLSWMNLTSKTATQEKVTTLLGQPMRVQENNKKKWLYYTHGNTTLVILWNKKTDQLEKFTFNCESTINNVFDNTLSRKIKSGKTDLAQVIKILGIPQEMTIKSITQEVHYAYRQCVLRLFFRNRTLVDYTLVSRQ